MTKKEQCKAIVERLFGPASAKKVDLMNEETVVAECRAKVKAFLGEEKAKEFDNIK